MSVLAQIVGVVLLTIGAAVLWGPFAWLVGGALLLVIPEVAALRRRRS